MGVACMAVRSVVGENGGFNPWRLGASCEICFHFSWHVVSCSSNSEEWKNNKKPRSTVEKDREPNIKTNSPSRSKRQKKIKVNGCSMP